MLVQQYFKKSIALSVIMAILHIASIRGYVA